MSVDLLERVTRAAAEVSGRPQASLSPDAPWSELGFDSLVLFELLMRLEDELGIELGLDDGEEPATLRAVVDLIAARAGV